MQPLSQAINYYLQRLQEPSTWIAIGAALYICDQQGVLPAAWHPYVLGVLAFLGALGIHLPSDPSKSLNPFSKDAPKTPEQKT